jgi:hypothetical protein
MLFPWAFVPWLTLLELIGLASFIGSFKLWVIRGFFIYLHDDDSGSCIWCGYWTNLIPQYARESKSRVSFSNATGSEFPHINTLNARQ